MKHLLLTLGALTLASSLTPAHSAPVTGTDNVYDLSTFGPLNSPVQADAALAKAVEATIAAGGGVLLIPANAPQDWQPRQPDQNMWRRPEAPAPAKSWGTGPAITLIDARDGKLALPEITGLEFNRTFSLRPGDSSPHWQYHPMMRLKNNFVSGTSNFSGAVTRPVAVGKAQNFYLESLRGVFPGQSLQVDATGRSLTVLSLGYDKEKKSAYFVADAESALPVGTVLSALTTSSIIAAQTRANNETQTFDIYNQRAHFSQGDTYMFDGYIHYMGDEYGIPDKGNPTEPGSGYGSVVYNARTRTVSNIFRGQVAAFDPKTGALKYAGASNAETLATGRPLINMNPKKWVTEGKAQINLPGGAILNWGDSIWSTDAPWTPDLVGRFIAIDEENEKVPNSGGVRSWFEITSVKVTDGKKRLTVRRHWWGAKNQGVGISTLRNYSSYTPTESKPVPLKYIIAPGTYVTDVSDGAGTIPAESSGARGRTIKLAPNISTQTAFDFAPGDAVEQAIGPEPFHPIIMRAWTWDEIPGEFPAQTFDIANYGVSPRNAALSVTGSGSFAKVFDVSAKVQDVFQVRGQVDGSLIKVRVRKNELPLISWTRQETPKSLTFVRQRDLLAFDGLWNLAGRSAIGVKYLSKAGVPGSNFRGLDVPVREGAKDMSIDFEKAEPDAKYAVTISPNWMTDRAVTIRTAKGFKVTFGSPAPAGATIQWLLVR